SPPGYLGLPCVSLTVTVMVANSSVVIDDALVSTVDCTVSAGPGKTSTSTNDASCSPSTLPVMVTVPAVVELNEAVYVPLPTSVTVSSRPSSAVSVTVGPPTVRLLCFASFSCTVMRAVLSVSMVSGSAVMVDVSGLAAPTDTSMVTVESMASPLTVPLIVTSPGVVGSKVAVYVPSPSSVTELSEP